MIWECYKRQLGEESSVINVLMDASLEELLEVARSMDKADQLKRLTELLKKHKLLDFDNAGMNCHRDLRTLKEFE